MSATVGPYPPGVVEVRAPIPGTAFFPGGLGLWTGVSEIPTGQIMIVGQDFNSKAAYDRAFAAGGEVTTSPTWRNLLRILQDAGISPDRCFFTNVYMGLRDGGNETGRFAGAKDKDFVRRCLTFFDRQLEVVQPKLILALGKEPLRMLKFSPVVPLTHPCIRANVRYQRHRGLVGAAAEQAMIAEAMAIAFRESPAHPAL